MNASALFFLFIITISQNASFTLVSRARNSGSLLYNGIASIFSNGIWYFVFRQIQTMPNDGWTAAVYIGAAAIGSVLMQWVAIRFLEKNKSVAGIMVRKPKSEGSYGEESKKGSTS
jgi:hypothetical protein